LIHPVRRSMFHMHFSHRQPRHNLWSGVIWLTGFFDQSRIYLTIALHVTVVEREG